MITKFNLGHLKRVAAPVLGHTPPGHNDGGSLYINCGAGPYGEDKCRRLLAITSIPGTVAVAHRAERFGSFAQREEREAAGTNYDTYLLIQKQ